MLCSEFSSVTDQKAVSTLYGISVRLMSACRYIAQFGELSLSCLWAKYSASGVHISPNYIDALLIVETPLNTLEQDLQTHLHGITYHGIIHCHPFGYCIVFPSIEGKLRVRDRAFATSYLNNVREERGRDSMRFDRIRFIRSRLIVPMGSQRRVKSRVYIYALKGNG